MLEHLAVRGRLAPGAYLVLEHEAHTRLDGLPSVYEQLKPPRYGDTRCV